jgi:hypothetical protein
VATEVANSAEERNGHVYILTNESMPDYLKIGMTTRTPDDRAKELSNVSGVPTPFVVAYSVEVVDCEAVESLVHARLGEYRHSKKREFFVLPIDDAICRVQQAVEEAGRYSDAKRPLVTDALAHSRPADALPAAAIHQPVSKRAMRILSVLRKHFRGVAHTYFHPDIPPKKKENARRRYCEFLAANEEVLLLYDGTFFGSAESGFIFSDKGIGWCQSSGVANYCDYRAIKPDEVCDGWTGFFVQGSARAEVWSADRPAVFVAFQGAIQDLWRERA